MLAMILLLTVISNVFLFVRIRKAKEEKRTAVCAIVALAALADTCTVIIGVPLALKNILQQHLAPPSVTPDNLTALFTHVGDESVPAFCCLVVLFRTLSILFHGLHILYMVICVVAFTQAQIIFSWKYSVPAVISKCFCLIYHAEFIQRCGCFFVVINEYNFA